MIGWFILNVLVGRASCSASIGLPAWGGGMVGVGAWRWRGDAGTFTFVAFWRGSRGGGGGVTRCVPGLKRKTKQKERNPAAAPRGAVVGPKVRDYAARRQICD